MLKADYSNAASTFADALALDPKDAPTLRSLAEALEYTGRHAAALHYYREVAKLSSNPKCIEYYARKMVAYGDYASAYKSLSGIASKSNIKRMLLIANCLEVLGRIDESLKVYDTILSKNGNCTDAIVEKARILLDLGKGGEALQLLSVNESVVDAHFGAHFIRGFACAEAGQRCAAIHVIDSISKADLPLPEWITWARGEVFYRLKDYETSLREFQAIDSKSTLYVRARIRVAECHLALKHFEEAVATSERFYADRPWDDLALQGLVHTLCLAGRHAEALVHCMARERRDSKPQWLEVYKGHCYYATGDYQSAIASFEGAMDQLDDEDWLYLGWCYAEEGQIEKAQDICTRLEVAGFDQASKLRAKICETPRGKPDWSSN